MPRKTHARRSHPQRGVWHKVNTATASAQDVQQAMESRGTRVNEAEAAELLHARRRRR